MEDIKLTAETVSEPENNSINNGMVSNGTIKTKGSIGATESEKERFEDAYKTDTRSGIQKKYDDIAAVVKKAKNALIASYTDSGFIDKDDMKEPGILAEAPWRRRRFSPLPYAQGRIYQRLRFCPRRTATRPL